MQWGKVYHHLYFPFFFPRKHTMAKTRIVLPTLGQEFEVPGVTLSADQVKAMYSDSIRELANMVPSTTTNTTPAGQETVITFTPRTGNKG